MKKKTENLGISLAETSRILSKKKEVLVRVVIRHPFETDMPTYCIFSGIGRIYKDGMLCRTIQEHNGKYFDLGRWRSDIESIEISEIKYKNYTNKLQKSSVSYPDEEWSKTHWDNGQIIDNNYM